MVDFKFEYNLYDAGWAEAIVWGKNESIKMTVSYLHDSLCDLADAGKSLINGSDSASVVFMDEPGEHQLLFQKQDNRIAFEVRWFDDWASWDMHPKDKYSVLLSGVTTLNQAVGELFDSLKKIHETYGLKKYKELWVEHEFPIYEYNQLKLLIKNEHKH